MKKLCFTVPKIFILTVVLAVLDLLTKYWFFDKEIWSHLSWIEPVFNRGVSWSIALDISLVVVISIAAMLLFLWTHCKGYMRWYVLAMLLAGSLGNLIDRIRFGGVRDFIALGDFPVFNIADILLNIGIALFIVHELKGGKGKRKRYL